MNHSMGDMMNNQTLGIAAVLLVSALIAIYGFNVSWGTLAPFAFLTFFVWMWIPTLLTAGLGVLIGWAI